MTVSVLSAENDILDLTDPRETLFASAAILALVAPPLLVALAAAFATCISRY